MKAKLLLLLVLFATWGLSASAGKPHARRIYLFGFAASFTDSVAFITPLQTVDSAFIHSDGRLEGRTRYSLQFAHYMEGLGKPNMTVCVFFDTNEKKAQKQYARLSRRYIKNPNVALALLPDNAFDFHAEEYIPDTAPSR